MTSARLAVCFCTIAAAAGTARAQSAEADVLFRDGKKLLKEGKLAEACEKLAASERLESSVGTLLNLGDCRERNHQLATAWAMFRKAAAAAKNARNDVRREQEARRREKLLAPRLSYLSVNVAEDSRVDGLAITRNGDELVRAQWNESVPVDQGDYELIASAEGYKQWTAHVRVSDEGQHAEVDVPALVAKPRRAAEPIEPAPVALQLSDHDEHVRPPRTTGEKTGIVTGVLGVTALVAGIALGVHADSLEQQSDKICPTTACNNAGALSANAKARRDDTIATNLAGGGLALAIAGAALWYFSGPKVAPVVQRDHVGLALQGRF